jgi:hypothetical protein
MKKRLTSLVAIATICFAVSFTVTGCSTKTSSSMAIPKSGSFKTPEDAITNFVSGVASNDLEKAFASFATQHVVEGYNSAAYAKRTLVLQLERDRIPSNDPFFAQLNSASETAQHAHQIKMMMYSLISSERESAGDGRTVRDKDGARTAKLAKSLDPKKLASLRVQQMKPIPGEKDPKLAAVKKIEKERASVVGADDERAYLVLYEFENKPYLGGVTMQRFGTTWNISSLDSQLSRQSLSGALKPSDINEFNAILAGNE